MIKFELFMGCLGNGITICNKAVEENGDYKKICHIGDTGKITWYEKPENIPGYILLKIEHESNARNANFEDWLKSMSEPRLYEYLLDHAPHAVFMNVIKMKADMWEKICYLKQALYQAGIF